MRWKLNVSELESVQAFLKSFTTKVSAPFWFYGLGFGFLLLVGYLLHPLWAVVVCAALGLWLYNYSFAVSDDELLLFVAALSVVPITWVAVGHVLSTGDLGTLILYLVYVIALVLLGPEFVKAWRGPMFWDKLEHFLLYFGLPIVFHAIGLGVLASVILATIINALYEIIVDGFGLLSLIHETYHEGASVADFVAGLAGSLIAAVLLML